MLYKQMRHAYTAHSIKKERCPAADDMEDKLFLQTPRRKTAYYRLGEGNRKALVLVHGNASSSAFFFPTMYALAERYDVIAPDLNGFGDTEKSPIHSPTALTDWAEDLHAFTQALGLTQFALLGWSLGGGVVMRYAILHPQSLTHLLLMAPMSPYGFGGTRGADGQMYDERGWGSPGGFANPQFLQKLAEKDDSGDPMAARSVLEKSLFANGYTVSGQWQDLYVQEVFKMPIGPDYYAGDYEALPAFPYVLPGQRGISNALAPQWANVTAIQDIAPKPPILWIRGDADRLVSDQSGSDLAVLGMAGYIPGYPGADTFPPQPMIAQTRAVLDQYAHKGGRYEEVVMEGVAHAPHLEQPDAFVAAVAKFLG